MTKYYCRTYQCTTLDIIYSKLEKFRLIFLIGCVIFGLAYFWQVNSSATRGFKIRELENSIQNLKQDTQQLELQAAERQSLEQITEKVKQLNMVVPLKIEYLQPTGSGVALR